MAVRQSVPYGRAILGGSFNPPHVGHLRLAVEVGERLGDLVTGVDLVPCAVPPHKDATSLLPFELRAAMVEACTRKVSWLDCNRLEGRRRGPSFTWDTLLAYKKENPEREVYFILGSPDFAQVPFWHRGLELPSLCHFVVVPREGADKQEFMDNAFKAWPNARECASSIHDCPCLSLPGGGQALFLPVPSISVSSSCVRQAWLAGRCVDFLLPEVVHAILREHDQEIREHWLKASEVS